MPESSLTADLLSGECLFLQAILQTSWVWVFFPKIKKQTKKGLIANLHL